MEEKERYANRDGVYDTTINDYVETDTIVDLLNQQDKQLKELENKHLLSESEYQSYCAFKIIEPEIKGCLDREKNLEKENQQLKQELNKYKETVQELQENNSKMCVENLYYRVNYNELKQQLEELKTENMNIFEYSQKIEQQLHDLPKKIVEEIKEWIKSQIIYCGGKASEVDILIANASNQVLEDLQNILDTILKKYGDGR